MLPVHNGQHDFTRYNLTSPELLFQPITSDLSVQLFALFLQLLDHELLPFFFLKNSKEIYSAATHVLLF